MVWPQLYLSGMAHKRKEQPEVWKHNSAKMMMGITTPKKQKAGQPEPEPQPMQAFFAKID